MRITFFELENWERPEIERELAGHELVLRTDALTAENAGTAHDTELLSVFIRSSLTRETLDQLPSLKFVATRSTGYDHIDVEECERRNIVVSNVPSYGENTVAEHTFGLILALSRRLQQAYLQRLTDRYSLDELRGFDLYGKTLGVVGTGRIGLHVIRIAKGFGMHVLAFDARPQPILGEVLGFAYVSLEELLPRSDIVTLHVPYLPGTHHLLNAERIGSMKDGAYLINTARGAIVDTNALATALATGKLRGAGLDVLEGEELLDEDRILCAGCATLDLLATIGRNQLLLARNNVVYTPHIAFDSQEALERILETTIQNIRAFVDGRPENVVTHPHVLAVG